MKKVVEISDGFINITPSDIQVNIEIIRAYQSKYEFTLTHEETYKFICGCRDILNPEVYSQEPPNKEFEKVFAETDAIND